LTLRDGDDAGDFVTAVPGRWKIGETFQSGSGFRLLCTTASGWSSNRAGLGVDRAFAAATPIRLAV
jgi:hypothetical protein